MSNSLTSVPRSEAEDGTRGRQDGLMKTGLHLEGDETLNKEQIGKLRQFWSKLQELRRHCLLGRDLSSVSDSTLRTARYYLDLTIHDKICNWHLFV